MQVFAQLTKVDVEKRLVFGIAAQETADHAGEIMDYKKSKPNFQSWSDEMSKATDGASLGNIRAMHGNTVAGKAVGLDFDDAAMSIKVCAKIVDNNEWQKVLEGCYTGFSMGGKYGEKWQDGDLRRYEAIPNEISLVDRPCIPTAKFFDIQKADGTVMQKAFTLQEEKKAAITDEVLEKKDIEYEVVGTAEDADALAKLLATNGLSIADAVAALQKSIALGTAPAEDDLDKSEDADLGKGMHDVKQLGDVLQTIYYLTQSAQLEAKYEGDNSPIPDRLKAICAEVASIYKDMAGEEIEELLSGIGTQANPSGAEEIDLADSDNAMTDVSGNMQMAAGLACELIKVGARNSAADADTIQKLHDMTGRLGAQCAKQEAVSDAAKFESIDDLSKAAPELLQKAIDAAIEPLNKRIKELEAMPLPSKGILRVVSKELDTSLIDEVVNKVEPVMRNGVIDEAATLMKNIHAAGGRKLLV
jgi:hypothetical protein